MIFKNKIINNIDILLKYIKSVFLLISVYSIMILIIIPKVYSVFKDYININTCYKNELFNLIDKELKSYKEFEIVINEDSTTFYSRNRINGIKFELDSSDNSINLYISDELKNNISTKEYDIANPLTIHNFIFDNFKEYKYLLLNKDGD